MPVDGLDNPCPACGRTSGDHTLREWAQCLGRATTELPYQGTPEDIAHLAAEGVRERFGLDPDLLVADHVTIYAATLDGSDHGITLRLPALFHEFQIGISGEAPVTIAKVAFIAEGQMMRAYGRLARDSANGAENAAGL